MPDKDLLLIYDDCPYDDVHRAEKSLDGADVIDAPL